MKTAILITVDTADPHATVQALNGHAVIAADGLDLEVLHAGICPECDPYERPGTTAECSWPASPCPVHGDSRMGWCPPGSGT